MKLQSLPPRLATADLRRVQPQPKQAAAHYQTPEHQAWRKTVLARANGACQHCHRTNTRLFADHVIELRDGGAALDSTNGQALCGACHSKKTAEIRQSRHRG